VHKPDGIFNRFCAVIFDSLNKRTGAIADADYGDFDFLLHGITSFFLIERVFENNLFLS
jgi:hypothetical protein